MCENRDGKFVVGHSVKMGWYVGVLDGQGVRLSKVIILRSEYPGSDILFTDKFNEFDTAQGAMDFADKKGA